MSSSSQLSPHRGSPLRGGAIFPQGCLYTEGPAPDHTYWLTDRMSQNTVNQKWEKSKIGDTRKELHMMCIYCTCNKPWSKCSHSLVCPRMWGQLSVAALDLRNSWAPINRTVWSGSLSQKDFGKDARAQVGQRSRPEEEQSRPSDLPRKEILQALRALTRAPDQTPHQKASTLSVWTASLKQGSYWVCFKEITVWPTCRQNKFLQCSA